MSGDDTRDPVAPVPRPLPKDMLDHVYDGPSMGALVPSLECPLCKGTPDHEHELTIGDIRPVLVYGLLDNFVLSSVPAPNCAACSTPMNYLGATDWECPNTACTQHGVSVCTGIGGGFPVGMVPESKEL